MGSLKPCRLPSRSLLARAGRHLHAALLRFTIYEEVKYLRACRRGGVMTEAEIALMRKSISTREIRAMVLETT